MNKKINSEDLKIGQIIRLGETTGICKGLQDNVEEIMAIDGDFCIVRAVDGVGLLIKMQTEIRLSQWTFFEVSEEYLKVLCPSEVWSDIVES